MESKLTNRESKMQFYTSLDGTLIESVDIHVVFLDPEDNHEFTLGT